jgi:hypothetical protein
MPDILITVVSGETTELGLSIPGVQGPAGLGVPIGGTVGQLIVKQSATNYDTAWSATLSGITINSSIASGLTIAGALVVPLASAATPSLTFTGDLDSGVFSPGADQVAVATNGTGRLFISSTGLVGIGTSSPQEKLEVNGNITNTIGCGGTFILYDAVVNRNNSIRLGADASGAYINASYSVGGTGVLRFQTVGVERGRFDESGRLGIGTSSPGAPLNVRFDNAGTTTVALFENQRSVGGSPDAAQIVVGARTYNHTIIRQNSDQGTQAIGGTLDTVISNTFGADLHIATGSPTNAARLTVTSAGLVGIGTTSPTRSLEVAAGGTSNNGILVTGSNSPGILISETSGSVNLNLVNDASGAYLGTSSNHPVVLRTNNTERARLDTSGRLLVGTSSVRSTGFTTQVGGEIFQEITNYGGITLFSNTNQDDSAYITLGHSRGTTVGSNTVVASGDVAGGLVFQGTDGTQPLTAARITAFIDGTPGANDMPGRLVFSTTADGAASPTERLRITSAGVLQIADAGNITVGTTTGTKIGTATTQKLGFYNATPVVQPTAVADATDAATVITQLNDLLAKLRTLGIIAT